MPDDLPPPLVPDFDPGFNKIQVGTNVLDQAFTVPGFDADGNLGKWSFEQSPWEAATQPLATYPDHHHQFMDATVSAIQVKMLCLSMLWQITNDECAWGLDLKPGAEHTGGEDGEWLVVP